jgi:hypothetical protein
MKKTGWMSAFSFFALLGMAGVAAAAPTCDETAVASAKTAIDTDCPCAGLSDGNGGTVPWKNHGQYVRCVTKAKKTEALNAGVARQCLKDVVPCAANSTCGKSNDDVACATNSVGTCQGDGTCENDPGKICAADIDCSVSSCAVMSPDECTSAGGSDATVTCCSQ